MTFSILLILTLVSSVLGSGHLDVLFQWRTMDFEFPDHATRERSIRNKDYIPGVTVMPLDVDVWHNGAFKKAITIQNDRDGQSSYNWRFYLQDFSSDFMKYTISITTSFFYGNTQSENENRWDYENDRTIFMTFPKFQKGIPASLVTVTKNKAEDSNLVRPYPDWSWHSPDNCEGMMSVFRTEIDKCGRLWVIDSGMVDLSLNSSRRKCQPKLLAFHLTNKRLAGQHLFPSQLLREHSILTNIAIDVRDAHNECLDTFAYVSDTTGYSLLVFDARRNKSWKVLSNSMYPYPPYGFFQTNDVEFNLMDGILGMALGPLERGDRKLYYHSLASVRESWVLTSILRNENYFSLTMNTAFKQFYTSEEARNSQSVVEAFDRNGVLYFGMLGDNSLSCWNSQKPFTRQHIHEITKDNTNLQFASGLKIILNEDDEEEIWILTSRFQLTMVDQMKPTEVNFRIIRGKIEELTRNTKCVAHSHITFPNRTKTNTNKPYVRPSTSNYGKLSLN